MPIPRIIHQLFSLRAMAVVCAIAAALMATPMALAQFDVLYTFGGTPDGASPYGSLVTDAKGNVYGTTSGGGTLGFGSVYSGTLSGKEKTIYTFAGGNDGAYPYGALLRDAKGNLYGTTSAGGGASGCFGSGCGTVFKIDVHGKETVLYRFKGGTDGGLPYSGLTMGMKGYFYGTASVGGNLSCGAPMGCGVVYGINLSGNQVILHTFNGGSDGAYPLYGSLAVDAQFNVYGTTQKGGDGSCNPPNGCGTVFKLSKTNKLSIRWRFKGGKDGSFPAAGVLLFNNKLYGTTPVGGTFDNGTVYDATLGGPLVKDTLWMYGKHKNDGATPLGGVTIDPLGNLYVPTEAGGTLGYGALSRIDTTGKESVVHNFNFSDEGGVPVAQTTYDAVCACLVGTTLEGGTTQNGPGSGTVWKWKR